MMQVLWHCDGYGCPNTAETPDTIPPDDWEETALGAVYCPECQEQDKD